MLTSYQQLAYSNLLDKVVYDMLISSRAGTWVFIFALFQVATGSIIPMISLYVRDKIQDFNTRMLFVWSSIAYTFIFGQYYWMLLFVGIELIRLFIMFGLLPGLKYIGQHIPHDAIGETALSRCFGAIKNARHNGPAATLFEIAQIHLRFQQGDNSEPWTESQRACLRKFFTEFEQTYFDIDTDHYTIFFPTFVIHVNSSGLHLTTDGAIILNTQAQNQLCAICREHTPNYNAQLRCGHEYCLKCIYEWLNHEYTCPMCRAQVI